METIELYTDERDAGLDYLTHDADHHYTGDLLAPCSRYGRTGQECAAFAWAAATIIAQETGEMITGELLDQCMSLAVNDHDDIQNLIFDHGDEECILLARGEGLYDYR